VCYVEKERDNIERIILTKNITLPQLAWHGVKKLELSLPAGWQVEVSNMAGYDRPRLKPAQIKKAIGCPIGMVPLREYARGKKEVVVIFDDMARVTRVAEIIPHVLAELAVAGIKDSQIRFIAACGCHDFAKKLGEGVMARFPVYNHNPFDNCVYAGTTARGTRVSINAEVMKCDLKIGIGSIVPHIMAGFGGGGKILLPGVAAYATIAALHALPVSSGESGFNDTVSGMGVLENNPRRRDIDEVAALVGLDMKIDAVVNMWGETVAIYAGAPAPAYAAALSEAKKHYLTPLAEDKDIVIANTFAKASEASSGLLIAFPSVSRRGGDIVLIANAPEGQVTHYLMGFFGNSLGGQLQLRMKPPPQVNRVIIFSEYPELSSKYYLEDPEKVALLDDWDDVLDLLKKSHVPGAKVAVYPNADIQYC
jgi:nickel-dependent lactate racemase